MAACLLMAPWACPAVPQAALVASRSLHRSPPRLALPALHCQRAQRLPAAIFCKHRRAAPAPPHAAADLGIPVLGAGERGRGLGARLAAVLAPFSDSSANVKLLALCTAQMLGSIATLMHELYLPVYLNEVLQLSNSQIGNLQALCQFMAKVSGSVSGTLADILTPARMVVIGTLLTALAKPMFALSGTVAAAAGAGACVAWLAFAKVFDRVSKGVREAPSKALIGELAAQSGDTAAAAFSLRQTLGTLGMLGGSAAASLAFKLSQGNYELTFALATIPAALALALVVAAFAGAGGKGRGERGAAGPKDAGAGQPPPQTQSEELPTLGLLDKARALLGALPPAYWQALATVALLYFARYELSFGTLRAKAVMDKASLPLLIPVMMVPNLLLSTPMGVIAKAGTRARNNVLLLGMAVLVLGNLCFAFVPTAYGMVLGALCIGVHMAMTHGVTLGMLSSYIPAGAVPGLGKVAGTAWSFTDLVLGFVLASSNSLAGRLSDLTVQRGLGPIGCFLGGGTACMLSMLALLGFSAFGHLGRDDLLPVAKAL